MNMPSAADLVRRRRARWAVPAGAVAAVGIVIAASVIGGAQASPRLPARTTAQLLAAVDTASAWPSALTATVQESASLGLPDLPGSNDPLSGLSLLSGTHTFQVWYDGPTRVRIAIPVQLGETDLRRDGNSVWLWNSQTNQATHYLLPAGASAGLPATGRTPPTVTPQQLAQQILAAVGKTTTVGLQQNISVAGQPAYQLSLAPKDSRSLIGRVTIAIDAKYSLPLQVQVFARGATSPAFSVAYTSLSFTTPAASNFAFAPPPGATVKTVRIPAGSGPVPMAVPAGGPVSSRIIASNGITAVLGPAGTPGPGSITVRAVSGGKVVTVTGSKSLPPAVLKKLKAALAKGLPASMPRAQRAAVLQGLASAPPGIAESFSGNAGPGNVAAFSSAAVASGTAQAVMGQGWLSVAVLPAEMTLPSSGSGSLGQAILALQSAATPVHGSWGSGRLLRTSLVSVLMTSSHILVGAVQPSVLYADAAHLGS
jgi:outer membrane lipoprotein-sorting protein